MGHKFQGKFRPSQVLKKITQEVPFKNPPGMFTQKIPKDVSKKIAQCSNICRKISQKYPRKVPEIFPRKPCGHRPNQKRFLKEASALFPKILPQEHQEQRFPIGAQKESQQKHPKPSTNSSPRNLSWLRPSETPRIVSSIEPSGDRIGRVEPGSMDLVQGLLRISSLADCMS